MKLSNFCPEYFFAYDCDALKARNKSSLVQKKLPRQISSAKILQNLIFKFEAFVFLELVQTIITYKVGFPFSFVQVT